MTPIDENGVDFPPTYYKAHQRFLLRAYEQALFGCCYQILREQREGGRRSSLISAKQSYQIRCFATATSATSATRLVWAFGGEISVRGITSLRLTRVALSALNTALLLVYKVHAYGRVKYTY